MEKQKKNRKTYILISTGIIISIMLTLGITYAFWRLTKEQTNENVVNTACLDFEITNEQDDIELKNSFPITDEEGYELTPYKFTIHNKCQDNATYQINLEMLEGSDLSTNYVKYVLNELKEKYILEYEYHYSDLESYDNIELCQWYKEIYEENMGYTITKDCQLEENRYVLEYKRNYTYKNEYDTNKECQNYLKYYQDDENYTVTKECTKGSEKVEPSYYDYYYLDDFNGFNILGEEEEEDEYVLDNAIEGKKLMNGMLYPNESKDFTLRLWIDEDVKLEDEIENKKLLSKITVSSTYLDEEMLRPTADLALSLCEKDIIVKGRGEAKYDREISKYEYKIDDGEWQVGTETYEFLNRDLGKHQVSVRVTDNQNSVSKEVTKEINIGQPEMVEIAGMQIPIATCKNGLYKVEHNDLSELDSSWNQIEYRYAGVNYTNDETPYVHNYVLFNNEKWRIIGLVNVKTDSGVEQRVKIIRTNGIEGQKDFGYYAWDKDGNYDEGTNNWTKAKLKDMLNGIYYNSESGECYIDKVGDRWSSPEKNTCDFSGNGDLLKGLDDTARKMIDNEVIWNIGGLELGFRVLVDEVYEKERGTTTPQDEKTMEYYPNIWTKENDSTYHNGIGLMYPSDYGYATNGGEAGRENCLKIKLGEWDVFGNEECEDNDWLEPIDINDNWTISPDFSTSHDVIKVFYYNDFGGASTNSSSNVYPVAYLTTSTTIYDGDGTISNPYKLR